MEIIFLHATRHKTLSWFDTEEACRKEKDKISQHMGDLYGKNEVRVATIKDKFGEADIAISHVAAVLMWDEEARFQEQKTSSAKNLELLIEERKRLKEAGVENIK